MENNGKPLGLGHLGQIRDKESSSETNLRTNSLQEWGNDKGLSQDSIQEELEDEPLQFKEPMTRAKSKRLKDQNYSRLIMLQAI